jgi:tRNA dimethylallyltransferase
MTYFSTAQPVIILVGPTAIGKTALSFQLAKEFDCEIVSMDSMQVYRYMDIGTAKATRQERERIPHHLIDIVDPDEDYDAERFVVDACTSLTDIHARQKIPLITGGTGLYLKALTEGLFPGGIRYPQIRAELKERLQREGNSKLHEELRVCDSISANRIHLNDSHRLLRALEIYHGSGIPWSQHILEQKRESGNKRFKQMLLIGLTCERHTLYEQINRRSHIMIDAGLEDEVRGLLERGYGSNLKSMMSIGYKHMLMYLQGVCGKTQMEMLLARDTRRYAKRQFTWFKKSAGILWFDKNEVEKIISLSKNWLAECS